MPTVDKYAIVAIRLNKKDGCFWPSCSRFPHPAYRRSSQTQRFTSTNAASMWGDEQGSSSMGDIPMRPRIAGFMDSAVLKVGNPLRKRISCG